MFHHGSSRVFPGVPVLLGIVLWMLSLVGVAAGINNPAEYKARQLIGQLGRSEKADRLTRQALRPWLLALRNKPGGPAPASGLSEGIWQGTLLKMRSDRSNDAGHIHEGLVRWRLQTDSHRLPLFFVESGNPNNLTNGQTVFVRGYRTGNRILATETARDLQTLLKR